MKRLIYANTSELMLNIDIGFIQYDDADPIAASQIVPVLDENNQINGQALADYQSFVQNVWEILSYYDFEMLKASTSKSFPNTSEYRWIAHHTQIDANDASLIIQLRLSNHFQNFNPEFAKELSKRTNAEAQSLKIPSTKKKQRYKEYEVVVNEETFDSYDEALSYIEKLVYEWLKKLHIDTTDYNEFLYQ